MIKGGKYIGILIGIFFLAAGKINVSGAGNWELSEAEVIIDTDQKKLNVYVETAADHSKDLSEISGFYQDYVHLNVTAGPEAYPANRPLQSRKTGRLRLAYPLPIMYSISNSREEMQACKFMSSWQGGQTASVFESAQMAVNYYQAKEYSHFLTLDGIRESVVIYDCSIFSHIMLRNELVTLIQQLIRARYNHFYEVQYQYQYPDLSEEENMIYSGSFKENLTYLALPYPEAQTSRYQCAGWLVEDTGVSVSSVLYTPLIDYERYDQAELFYPIATSSEGIATSSNCV